MYAFGHGVSQDYTTARGWYEKAAVQGFAMAQSNLGVLYRNGQGVPQDYDIAQQWLEKAAAQGLAYAQNDLGYLFIEGKGVPKDETKGVKWIQKPPNRETQTGKIHSARCTAMDTVCYKTMFVHTCGTTSQRHTRRVTCRSWQQMILKTPSSGPLGFSTRNKGPVPF